MAVLLPPPPVTPRPHVTSLAWVAAAYSNRFSPGWSACWLLRVWRQRRRGGEIDAAALVAERDGAGKRWLVPAAAGRTVCRTRGGAPSGPANANRRHGNRPRSGKTVRLELADLIRMASKTLQGRATPSGKLWHRPGLGRFGPRRVVVINHEGVAVPEFRMKMFGGDIAAVVKSIAMRVLVVHRCMRVLDLGWVVTGP